MSRDIIGTDVDKPEGSISVPSCESTVACPWAPDDQDLVSEFLVEVEEHLGRVDLLLLDAEQSDLDSERIRQMFGAFHSLKGVASFLHLQQFQELTHTTETMLSRIRDGQYIPTRLVVDLVLDATRQLRELGEYVRTTQTHGGDLRLHAGVPALLARLKDAIDHATAPVTATAVPSKQSVTFPQEPPASAGAPGDAPPLADAKVATGVEHPGTGIKEEAGAEHPPTDLKAEIRPKQLVKVDLERVDYLVEAIGELVIVESMVSNATEINQLPAHLRNYLGQFAKITRELQELGMRMRMVQVRSLFQKMTRLVRDLARQSNKLVHIEIAGESTELDRIMVEQIADPLVHLIRNAVDHGIEPPEERIAAGKPKEGTVKLSARHEGGSIIVEISDDGRGIDQKRVLSHAVALGIVDRSATLTETQIFELIFAPGFSTAREVTAISGRGVGMDVVRRNIEGVRGRITTQSTPGHGTTFRLVLPLTLAIIDAMVIRCGNERFVLPTLHIVESLQPSADMLFRISGHSEHILVRGQTLPLLRLEKILGISNTESDPTNALVIIVESLQTQVALLVDEVMMKQQVVIKTLSRDLDSTNLFAGAAILANGRVGLIINVDSLINASFEGPVRVGNVTPDANDVGLPNSTSQHVSMTN